MDKTPAIVSLVYSGIVAFLTINENLEFLARMAMYVTATGVSVMTMYYMWKKNHKKKG